MAKVGEKTIDLTPTEGMKAEARRYRAWKQEGRPGGTNVAATRAGQILSGDELSPETVITMAAWFARHEVDKQGKGFRPDSDSYPSPGRVAWAAWGGDSGQTWSTMKSKAIKKARERAMDEIIDERPYPNEHAARLNEPGQYDSIRRVNDEGGPGVDFIYGIKDGKSEIQAIRFDAKRFTPAEARQWLKDHDFSPISFEEATGGRAEEELEERAYDNSLKVGDFVEWDSSGGMVRGKIIEVKRSGIVEVPDSSFTLNGSEKNPAALIRVYQKDANGYQESDTVVGHYFSTLKKIPALRFLEGETLKRSLSTEFRAAGEDRTLEFSFASEKPVERYYGMEVLNMDQKSMDLTRLNDGAPLLFQHDPEKIVGVVQKAYIQGKRAYAKVKLANNDLGREMQGLIQDGIIRNVSFGYKINSMEADQSTTPVTYRATSYQPFEISLVTVPADESVGIGRAFSHNEGTETASAVPSQPNGVTTVDQNLNNIEAIRAEAAQAKAKEVAEMIALGQRTKNIEMAQEFIANSRGLDELRSALLEKMGVQEKPLNPKDAEIGMSEKEKRDFSFIRAINALAHPNNQEAQRAAAFEMEVSRAAEQKSGKEARGILVPADVLGYGRRDLTVGSATGGGDLVATDLMSDSFIDLLRKALVLQTAGATVMTGLQGMVALPRQSGGATVYHVAESASITESQLSVDQVTMQPRTIGALTDYSRRLLLQSSIDIENLVRRDLAQQIAIEVENQAINGTGASSYPLGFLNVTGINTESGYTAFSDYVNAEASLSTSNALLGTLGYLMNSTLRGTLKTTEKSATGTNANFIYEANNTINGYPAYVSNSMPANTAVFANFSDILIGFWSGLDIMVDPYTGSTSGTVRVIAMQDYDVAVRHPESICKLS